MPTIEITDESFREIYKKNEIVVLDFWASWCGPCHQFLPIFEEVSDKYLDVVFGKVNTEIEQKLSSYFLIRSIPTLIVIREELEVFRNSGVIGEKDLSNLIEQVKEADMDEVRKRIEVETEAETET